MKFSFKDLEAAYEFVSSGPYGEQTALLDKSTGRIHGACEMAGIDEIPDALWDSEHAVEIPHQSDLGLGSDLVFDFIVSRSPDDYELVQGMFSRRGAYSRYKGFLEARGLLQEWYDFEQRAQEKALRRWCQENEIELTDESSELT